MTINSNRYYAITINNSDLIFEFKLTSIDSVRDFIIRNFADIDKKIYTISVERNELNQNIHYHILLSSLGDINDWHRAFWWCKHIDTDIEIIRYNNYIKKDGLYKVYIPLELEQEITNKDTWYNQALLLIPKYETLKDLFTENPQLIKQIHKVEKLWYIINNNPRN